MEESLYSILGVKEDASTEEIKRAYRELSKTHHPDKGGDDAEFARISGAYGILSDDTKRAAYDSGEDPEAIRGPQQIAESNLCSLLNTIVTDPSFMSGHTDVIVRLREEINDKTIKMNMDIEDINVDIKIHKDVLERISAPDFIKKSLTISIKNLELAVANIEKALKIQDIMLDLIKDSEYKFEVDGDMEWAN